MSLSLLSAPSRSFRCSDCEEKLFRATPNWVKNIVCWTALCDSNLTGKTVRALALALPFDVAVMLKRRTEMVYDRRGPPELEDFVLLC